MTVIIGTDASHYRSIPNVRATPSPQRASVVETPDDTSRAETQLPRRPTADASRFGRARAQNDPRTAQLRTQIEDNLDGELSREAFLDKFGDKTIRADTRLPGVAYLDRADLNDDGVISGREEWAEAFKEVDLYDKNGDANTVDTANEKVAASLASLEDAPDGARGRTFYGKRQRVVMDSKLRTGEPHISTAESYDGKRTDYLGRRLSDRVHTLTLGYGSAGDVDVVYDSKKNRFYKQQNGGPLIALSRDEIAAVKKNLADNPPPDGVEAPINWHYNIIYAGLYPEQADRLLPEFDF